MVATGRRHRRNRRIHAVQYLLEVALLLLLLRLRVLLVVVVLLMLMLLLLMRKTGGRRWRRIVRLVVVRGRVKGRYSGGSRSSHAGRRRRGAGETIAQRVTGLLGGMLRDGDFGGGRRRGCHFAIGQFRRNRLSDAG